MTRDSTTAFKMSPNILVLCTLYHVIVTFTSRATNSYDALTTTVTETADPNNIVTDIIENAKGGIAPNEVIARSELEVHREMFTE